MRPMTFATAYLGKQKDSIRLPESSFHPETGIIVVVPCFHEPHLSDTLDSLCRCSHYHSQVEVLIVFNYPEGGDPSLIAEHKAMVCTLEKWREPVGKPIHFTSLDTGGLPGKVAGPGMARKLGMDWAVDFFSRHNRPQGIIVSLDGDCLCSSNYLAAIERHFERYPDLAGCTIYFEHPLEGDDFPPVLYEGIARYEIHMRTHVQALRYAGFPYAFHTVGSCFAVRARTYVAQGGMNRRQGGEDFYFLHKVIPSGRFRELNSTRVIPSPRPSARVPFGTGPQMMEWLDDPGKVICTYHPEAYAMLQSWFQAKNFLYQAQNSKVKEAIHALPKGLACFLDENHAVDAVREINQNVASMQSYQRRFFRWFNAFRVIKFMNTIHGTELEKMPVKEAALTLLKRLGIPCKENMSEKEILLKLRKLEKEKEYETGRFLT